MKNIKGIIIMFALLVTLIATGCESSDTMQEIIDDNDNEKFTLSDDHGYADDYGFAYYIEGTVTNNTDKSYSYVQISFNAYDSDGNTIGSCLDNINNFDAKGTWKIKAICSGDANSISSYKLTDYTSW